MVIVMQVEVTTLAKKSAGQIELQESIYGLPTRPDILQRVVQYTASMETGDFYDFTYPGPPNLRNSHSASVASTYGIAVSKNLIPRNQWFTIRARVRFGDYSEQIDSVTTRIDVGGHYQLFYVDDWKLSRPDGARLSVFLSGSTDLSLGTPSLAGQPAW